MSEFQAKLDAIAAERAARQDLISRRVETSLAESQARTDELTRETAATVQRLAEQAARARTAAGWERPEKPDPNASLGMAFEDPDMATEPTNRHAPPLEPAARRGRHARPDDPEDDYSNKDWLG
ncbi:MULTISPECIES: hypothetical protein [Amycolatopsis]|uniref:Uncharacterized protein n=2 Tax=Amycolatopsis thermalba TaxID=944492 RepID=A0ABY4NP09_9PSEU|nr:MULTISPECIES: hypothetical protein [Amycolatopsis]OXM73908.1 hypothetical protein CF166_07495 [Amycolatopsis sp. KNN50.9b]UQS22410.1 hypothetical protein L1857_06050 [Amycolatopsis thermalba]